MMSKGRLDMSCRLERLELDMCGRGFGDSAVTALCSAAAGKLPTLRVLSLGGAYRLSDAGLLNLLQAAPALQELHLAQCCRIEGTALQQLPSLTKGLRYAALHSASHAKILICLKDPNVVFKAE